MTIEQRISDKIQGEFGPNSFVLKNESAKHAGHAGDNGTGDTHFHLQISAEKLASMSRVEAQRYVYALLDQEFKDGLHALSLKIIK